MAKKYKRGDRVMLKGGTVTTVTNSRRLYTTDCGRYYADDIEGLAPAEVFKAGDLATDLNQKLNYVILAPAGEDGETQCFIYSYNSGNLEWKTSSEMIKRVAE